ncbi:MAG: hypothetical protein L0G22_05035 [Propionibacteriaceae bacterium]|nr:hypothetical protein [Propionibacteriaceae bacterium]
MRHRHPSVLDAMIRRLILTAAGAALLVLFPSNAFGGRLWLPATQAADLTVAQLAGLLIITIAWASHLVHLGSIPAGNLIDLLTLVLAGVGASALVAVILSVVHAVAPAVIASLAVLALAQIGLALRIDRVRSRARASALPGTLPALEPAQG